MCKYADLCVWMLCMDQAVGKYLSSLSLPGPGSYASSDDTSVSTWPAVSGCSCCSTARLPLPTRHVLQARYTAFPQHTNTHSEMPVFVNELCQVRNVLKMSTEIYKPSLFTSGSIHWTQWGLECLFHGCKCVSCITHPATWNFTLSLPFCLFLPSIFTFCTPTQQYTHQGDHSILLKRRHEYCMFQQILSIFAQKRSRKHLKPMTEWKAQHFIGLSAPPAFIKSFAHSFLPNIPPGACLTQCSTDPSYEYYSDCMSIRSREADKRGRNEERD